MSWLDRHRVIRRAILVWALWLITVTAQAYFYRIGEINAADAAVITGIIGILSIVIGYQKNGPGSS